MLRRHRDKINQLVTENGELARELRRTRYLQPPAGLTDQVLYHRPGTVPQTLYRYLQSPAGLVDHPGVYETIRVDLSWGRIHVDNFLKNFLTNDPLLGFLRTFGIHVNFVDIKTYLTNKTFFVDSLRFTSTTS